MRCLYCGNELALLKKLRGGGEFCSEAHRQKYQEEYTQLALNRLMQAHPKAQKRTPPAAAPAPAEERVARQPEAPPPVAPPPPPKPVIAAPELCGFLLQRFEPRPHQAQPFSHGAMPMQALAAAVSRNDATAELVRELPHAEGFRPLEFTLRPSAALQLAAPEFLDSHFPPEFHQTADSCLRVLPVADVPAAVIEAAETPEPVASSVAAGSLDRVTVVETPREPEALNAAAGKVESFATVEARPEPEAAIPDAAHDNNQSVVAVEERPDPEPEIAGSADDSPTPARRPLELHKVVLRLAPPPNSGVQDVCRPTPFPLSGPDLPRVKPNILRLRFGFAPPPTRAAGSPATTPESSHPVSPISESSLRTHTFLTFEGPVLDSAKPEGRSKLPLILSIVGALLLAAVAAVFLFSRGSTATAPIVARAQATPHPIDEADWTTDWSAKSPRGEQFSILRPSLIMSDYQIQFQGQIDSKSLGWIFRATDPKNYYALKLEFTKPGATAEVALIRTVVDGGQQKNRSRIPLKTVARDTVFKIRTSVAGSTFQTWIQGELVDTWHDDRFKTGGFGLLTDAAGRARLQMIQLSELQDSAQKR